MTFVWVDILEEEEGNTIGEIINSALGRRVKEIIDREIVWHLFGEEWNTIDNAIERITATCKISESDLAYIVMGLFEQLQRRGVMKLTATLGLPPDFKDDRVGLEVDMDSMWGEGNKFEAVFDDDAGKYTAHFELQIIEKDKKVS